MRSVSISSWLRPKAVRKDSRARVCPWLVASRVTALDLTIDEGRLMLECSPGFGWEVDGVSPACGEGTGEKGLRVCVGDVEAAERVVGVLSGEFPGMDGTLEAQTYSLQLKPADGRRPKPAVAQTWRLPLRLPPLGRLAAVPGLNRKMSGS